MFWIFWNFPKNILKKAYEKRSLKITDFKPEYLGKMEFYLEALDRHVKKEHEKPSVGIILCKSKDKKIVEYALSRSVSPALVSEYQTKLFDKKLLERK